jgi:methionyl-tRNA formyltransferase
MFEQERSEGVPLDLPRKVAILGAYEWNFVDADRVLGSLGIESVPVRTPKELEERLNTEAEITWAFAPHWRYLIKPNLLSDRCFVGFHVGKLPDDRGGSPIQHQILRGAYASQLCAFRIDSGIDTGPIYAREDFDLSEGSLEEILRRASLLSARMMGTILTKQIQPVVQTRVGTIFSRRSPDQSRIPPGLAERELYDFIRMLELDCPGYPPAYVVHDGQNVCFSSASLGERGLTVAASFGTKQDG